MMTNALSLLPALLLRVFLTAPLLGAITSARAEELIIAVASNFTAPMQEIAQTFEAQSGHKVQLAFGSSGKLYAQIRHGAPFQALFSADQQIPARLEAEGYAVADSRFTYAEGKLVLWSPHADAVDPSGAVLAQGAFRRLALANPRLAPYGAAAQQALEALGLLNDTRTKWVQGENISQTYQFVATGNAELGLIALSQVMRDGKLIRGSSWIVPPSLYAPIKQDAVILQNGKNSQALRDFWQFLHSDSVQQRIASFGYVAGAGENSIDHQ